MESHFSPKTAFCTPVGCFATFLHGAAPHVLRGLFGVALGLVVLQGTNCLAAATVAPASLSWASVAVGSKGAPKAVTLTNGNSTALTISSIAFAGANAGDFQISSKTCGTTLAADASCTASVVFAPTTSGTRTATLNFSDSDSTSPQKVTLSGLGTGGTGGSASVSPTSLSWASVAVGNKGAQKAVTLTNSGSTALNISSISVTGANPGDFQIASKTCGTSLGASSSCTVNITFGPLSSGTRTATLSFSDSATNSPQSVSLSGLGTGGSGTVTISPASLAFGSVNVGTTSAAKTTTLTNGGSSTITINNIAVTGTNSGDFLIASKTCGSSLAKSASCTISVTFKPTTTGSRAATLTVSDTSSNSPQTAALTGTGGSTSSGSVSVSPTSIGFPNTSVGSTSAAQTATLTNGTKSSVTISSVSITGANPGDFIISAKTCGTSLAASASCTASVAFKPTASGARNATLSFADSASNSPQTVSLSGSNPGVFQIVPMNPVVTVNNALEFSATTDVTWSASCGSIGSTSGNYTAPSTTGSCTVTATQIGGTHATVSTTAKIVSGPASGTLAVYPTSAAVYSGTTQVFQAQLSGVPDGHSLTYSVDGVNGGNGTTGTITNQGIYTAPSGAGTHHLTVKDNSLGTTATATIVVFSKVTVDFASRSTSLHAVPAHLFGAERMDSMRNTADLDLVKAAGINYARFYALIPQVFASKTPNWSSIDGNIRRISAGGVKIMLQMHQTPPWLLPSGTPCGSDVSQYDAMPTDVNQWAQMAVQYVNHMEDTFPGVVTDYEIWNEPNTGALCVSTANKLSSYLKLYDAAAPLMIAAIKAHPGSTAKVGGPATAGFQSTWVKAMLADPVASQNMGFMAYHDYMFSSTQTGAQWDTYNGTISVYQRTQNTGAGPMATYLYAAQILKDAGKNIPLYNTEYNLNWSFSKNCCQNDPIYSPVWNGMYVADVLNAVYNGAHPNAIGHMVYFAATAHPYFCLVGQINANMDCTYPTTPQPYPQYFLYQLLGSPTYLGLQNGGYMANSISPSTLGNGLVVTAFYTTNLDAIVLVNPTSNSLDDVTVTVNNTGLTGPSGTLYQIVNGQSIQSSSVSLQSQGGTSYSTTVTIPAYTVKAISIHR